MATAVSEFGIRQSLRGQERTLRCFQASLSLSNGTAPTSIDLHLAFAYQAMQGPWEGSLQDNENSKTKTLQTFSLSNVVVCTGGLRPSFENVEPAIKTKSRKMQHAAAPLPG